MKISKNKIIDLFVQKIEELQREPDFQWSEDESTYMKEENGKPKIKLSVGNISPEYDLWEGLRNPAKIGLYPAGLEEIWQYYAYKRRDSTDETGRETIFTIPDSFEYAREKYDRAVLVTVMLPFSRRSLKKYSEKTDGGGSSHLFSKIYKDVNLMIDNATSRAAIDLVTDKNAVVAMDNRTVKELSKHAIPQTKRGGSHGPSKGGNFPQKSLASLFGLGQFGVSRLILRDEITERGVERFMGPIRSIVIFDQEEPVKDGAGGLAYPSSDWRKFLGELFDFTNPDSEMNNYRYCNYLSEAGSCGKCLESCPSGAQENSTPGSDGNYSAAVKKQTHRFWNEELQFDFAQCCEERGQMNDLYPEWSCAHCLSVCATEGSRSREAVKNFNEKKESLLKAR